VYIHGLFQQRCRELGITSVYSPPHEHERNGSSEKTFRDIGDLAHTMMATSAFPSTGWTHAYLPSRNLAEEQAPHQTTRRRHPVLPHVRQELRHVQGSHLWLPRLCSHSVSSTYQT
jgi:hypothetical protein